MIRWLIVAVVLAGVPALMAQDTQSAQQPQQAAKPADASAAGAFEPVRVKLKTSIAEEPIILELYPEKAPLSVQNFLAYVKSGFYEGTIFHRVMHTFMIQGGGYTKDMDEKKEGLRPPIQNEWKNGLKNRRGSIAMARTNAPDSAQAQFFINVVDNERLDQPISGGAGYAVFGKVVEGMNVVDQIRNTKVINHDKYPSPEPVTPETPVVIESATIVGDFDVAKLNAHVEDLKRRELEDQARAEAERMKEIQEAIDKIEQETGQKLQKTESGLMYAVLRAGDGPSPGPTDNVEVHYKGTFLDGQKFDSSYDRERPARFRLDAVIRGWTEGVGMMKPGEKRLLVIPPDLAYGARGRPGIPPNSTLVFEVELLAVNPE